MSGGRAVLCCALVTLTIASPTDASTTTGDRLVNPGAEQGLAGWQGTGVNLAAYESDEIPRFPAPNFVLGPDWQLGDRLFTSAEPSAIWQIVGFGDLAGSIDAGQQYLSWGGLLGGRGGQAGGARLIVQPLDATARALGEPYIVGNPSDRDRQFRTALLPCRGQTAAAPIGMRGALVTLEMVAHGLADDLYLTAVRLPAPAAAAPMGGLRIADGPGCETGERLAPDPPDPAAAQPTPARRAPRLRSLVTMPTSNRCGRPEVLRFRVHRAWRAKVATLTVRARARRIVRGPAATITVAASPRKLRVALSVQMRDGRKRQGVQQFSGCARR
jgi:hypothetical protein